jgi:hypothetical protein
MKKDRKLIIDIGSGHKPHSKSDILLEKLDSDNTHRWGNDLILDRHTILYSGDKFPIKDKIFDFSICTHVLEHVPQPDIFLDEVSRISSKGYIETPSEFSELIFTPYSKHLWIINKIDDMLYLRNKLSENTPRHGALFDFLIDNEQGFREIFYSTHRKLFLVEYSWDGKIKYTFEEPRVIPESKTLSHDFWKTLCERNTMPQMKNTSIDETIYKTQKNLTKIDWEELLMCNVCGDNMNKKKESYVCMTCGKEYSQPNEKTIICR